MKRALLLLMTLAAIVSVACTDDDADPTASPTPTATADLPDDNNDNNGNAGGTFPAAAGPGISVSEALASTLDGPLLVNGYLVITLEGARLCEALAESFPPQCGGASLILDAPDPSALAQVTTEGDVSWTDDQIQMLGTIDGDTMTVQPLASA